MLITVSVEWIFILLALGYDPDQDDSDLARKIKNGDQKAFKAFFDRHHTSLFYMLIGKGVSEDVAEDIIQQAFISIWEKRSDIDEKKSIKAYLFRIGYNRALNHFRDTRKFDASGNIPDFASGKDPSDEAQERFLLDAIDKSVDQMPEKRRAVFELCFMQGLTYREASEVLGVSIKTIENHMGYALKSIRKSLSEFKIDH